MVRTGAGLCCALAALLCWGGCGGPRHVRDRDENLSLVAIGEKAFDTAERLEAQGKTDAALAQYRKAVWALSFHEELTGSAPLLLDEARAGERRLSGAGGEKLSPK